MERKDIEALNPLYYCKIPGRVGIKKNSKRLVNIKGRMIPISSKKYLAWEKEVSIFFSMTKSNPTITDYVTAIFIFNFSDKKWEIDTSNGVEGPADILQKVGIISDDKLIKSFYAEKNFNCKEDSIEVLILPL